MKTGQTIGRYRLQEKIGKGGMAEIFKADETLEDGSVRTVAIKRLFPKLSADREFVGMFVNEALIASNMDHGNIIRTYDLINFGSYYYIVMEYLEGLDLEELVILRAPSNLVLSIAETAYVVHEVAMGLDYAHETGGKPGGGPVVHRDISPGNILVGCNGEVKITDFGIARATQYASFTRPGVLKGKYEYMAPEYVKGKQFDGRADLFSLGVVLYELLTGENPFMGVTPQDIWDRILKLDPPAPSEIVSSVPRTMDLVVSRALTKDPKKRFSSGEGMAAVLLPFFDDPGPEQVAELLGERTRKTLSKTEGPTTTQYDFDEFLPPDDDASDNTREVYLDELLGLVDPVDVPHPLAAKKGADIDTAPKLDAVKPLAERKTRPRRLWAWAGAVAMLAVTSVLTMLLWPGPSGLLSVESDRRAEVYVDGKRMGLAPLNELPLDIGYHVIEAKRPGREQAKSFKREIKEGEHVKLSIRWEKPKRRKRTRKSRKKVRGKKKTSKSRKTARGKKTSRKKKNTGKRKKK